MKQATTWASSGQKEISAAVCGVREGLLEQVRGWPRGRDKEKHLRQEAQHVGRPGGARGLGSLRNWEGFHQAAIWRKQHKAS